MSLITKMSNSVLTADRRAGLEKNFKLMFWIRAFMGFAILNVVISIFYIHRGLTLQQIFYLGVVFAVTNLIFEIPSSYMADRWGRKKTIVLAVFAMALSSVFCFFAHSFLMFAVDIFFYALSYALISGTDDALIYDTTRELGRDGDSLKELGSYYSAQRYFKILTPLLGVFIAQGMLEWQFQIIIAIEFLTALIALPFVFMIVEPMHKIAVEDVEAGIIKDAWRLIRTNPDIIRAIISRTGIFMTGFLVWRIHQEYFVNNGVTILGLGIMWMVVNAIGYAGGKYIVHIFPQMSSEQKVTWLNIIFVGAITAFTVTSFFPNPWLLVIFFATLCIVEVLRWPIFSDLFNKRSKSFNRATTLSLTNFIKSIIDVPLTLVAAWLVSFSPSYVFVFVTVVALGIVLFVPVHEKTSVKIAV